jgi:hypothetical protein
MPSPSVSAIITTAGFLPRYRIGLPLLLLELPAHEEAEWSGSWIAGGGSGACVGIGMLAKASDGEVDGDDESDSEDEREEDESERETARKAASRDAIPVQSKLRVPLSSRLRIMLLADGGEGSGLGGSIPEESAAGMGGAYRSTNHGWLSIMLPLHLAAGSRTSILLTASLASNPASSSSAGRVVASGADRMRENSSAGDEPTKGKRPRVKSA